MNTLLEDRRVLLPTVVTALVIAIGATLIILLAGDSTSGGSADSGSAPAAASGPAEGGSGEVVKVAIKDFKFAPADLTVKAGTTVEWTNEDTAPHNAVGEDQKTDDLQKGDSGEITFDAAGTFEYLCTFHAFMKGKVIVE